MPEIEFFHLTDTGCVREDNEDAVGSWPHDDGLLFAVADGLGGYTGGELASALALEALAREMARAPASWPVQKRLRRSVQQANLDVYTKAMTVPELRHMGTTLTASVLVGDALITAHIGDCRLYLLREGTLVQLTKDHTRVAEQVEYGILSAEEARTHPQRHVLSRCLGHNVILAVDMLRRPIQPGDIFVQCSDGIHTSVLDSEVAGLLRDHSVESACRAIVERAREAGGEDNLSVQVASVRSCSPPRPRSWWRLGV
jgi:PPM family protein phosphatase